MLGNIKYQVGEGFLCIMTSLFSHFLPKNDQMTQINALYSNKQNVPDLSLSWVLSIAWPWWLYVERGPYRDTEGFIETSIERENYVMLSMQQQQSLSCGWGEVTSCVLARRWLDQGFICTRSRIRSGWSHPCDIYLLVTPCIHLVTMYTLCCVWHPGWADPAISITLKTNGRMNNTLTLGCRVSGGGGQISRPCLGSTQNF